MGATYRTRQACILLALVAFLATCVFTVGLPTAIPVSAKGVVKTKPKDDSSDPNQSNQQKQEPSPPPKQEPARPSAPPQESKPSYQPAPRQEPAPSRDDGVFSRGEERRDTPSQPPSIEPSPGQRGPGSADVSSQIMKRGERRESDYEFRKHYIDPFFYPYDSDCHRHYPYYDRGTVIIIQEPYDPDTNRHRRGNGEPGSVQEALDDIEAAWADLNTEFLMWHVDPDREIRVFYKGKYSHSLTAREIYKLTAEAFDRTETKEFRFTSVKRSGYEASAKARHVFVGPDRKERTAYLTYTMIKLRNRWVIDKIDFRKTDFGSPRCFIATAAYGTPMASDVLVLRKFRDKYLLTNAPGRALTAAYYRISPPVADVIARNEQARGVVRALLRPVVQACRFAGADADAK